jgi:plasmid maintenance system antidote protein VapI
MLAAHVNEILKLRRTITADTAKHLAAYFGMAAMYWVSLQVSYDLSRHKIEPVQAIII